MAKFPIRETEISGNRDALEGRGLTRRMGMNAIKQGVYTSESRLSLLSAFMLVGMILLTSAAFADTVDTPIIQYGYGDLMDTAMSPDGTKMLTGSEDGKARLWDLSTGNVIRTFTGHTSWVSAVAFSSDGTQVLTGSGDATAKLWNAASGAEIRSFTGHTGSVRSVAFSPDGTQVLTGSGDCTAKLWNAATGAVIRTFSGHTDDVDSVAFSPNGTKILTGAAGWNENTAKLWDAATGAVLRTFSGHMNGVKAVAFSPGGTQVLTGSWDGTAMLWYATGSAPPTVTLVMVQSGLTVDVTFSEAMGAGVTTPANYTLLGSGQGTLAASPDSVALQTGNTYRLTWNPGEMFDGGDITVTVANVEDLAGIPIGSPDSGTDVGGAIGVTPQVSSATATDNTTVRVVFNEAMTNDAALVNAANYTFTGGGAALMASSVVRINATTVDVTVNEMTDGGSYTVHVQTGGGGPTDLASNHVDPAHNSAGFTGMGGAPEVSSATSTDSTTVRVVFNEAMTNNAALVNAANYTFTGGGVALTASGAIRVNGTTVDVTVNEMTDDAAYTIHVETGAGGPTDLASNHVAPAHNSAGFTGVGAAPRVSSATATGSATVRVVFNEAMTNDAALVNASNYTFTGGGVSLAASGVARISATTVDVTVNEMTNGAAYTVHATTTGSGPTDLASNHVDLAHNSAGFAGVGVAPQVSSATATDNTTVRVVFSEAMTNDAALVSTANYTFTGGGVALTAASVLRVDASTVAVTVNEMTGGVVYTIHVETGLSGPTDLALHHVDPANNSAGFTGGGDPPQVVSATPQDSTTVQVIFNEAMTDNGALVAPANYTFTGGGVALTASSVLRVGEATVDVTVNEMTDGAAYMAHVETGPMGPTDLVLNHVDPVDNTAGFTGIGIAPVVSIDSVSPPYAKDGDTVTVQVTATDNVAVVGNPLVTLNGTAMAHQGTVGNTYTYTLTLPGGSTEGAATIVDSADDAAGNSGADVDTTSLTIDNTPPSAPVVSGVTPVATLMPTWTWVSGGFGNGLFRYGYSEGVWIAVGVADTDFTPGVPLMEDTHTLYVQERDDAGNWSVSGSHAITCDVTPPEISVDGPNPATTTGEAVIYTATYIDADAVTLMEDDITLLTTGDAWADVTVSGAKATSVRTITLDNFAGVGTITVKIEAGTASDLAGNTAPEYTTAPSLQVDAPSVPLRPYWLLLLLPVAALIAFRHAREKQSQ